MDAMMMRLLFVPLLMIATCSSSESPLAGTISVAARQTTGPFQNPARVGECAERTIAVILTRLNEKLPSKKPRPGDDGGSYVRYTNNDTQVSYEWNAALVHSKVGDKVRFCLISIPKDCPPGDDRGRVYETTNLRTHGVWKMQDDPHMCGGA
jgi:hypothetical protein